jgi:hypothetical protein
MEYGAKESAFRKLVWIEAQKFGGWGCSRCAWVFHPSELPAGKSLEELTDNLQRQLDDGFASHECAQYPPVKGASA